MYNHILESADLLDLLGKYEEMIMGAGILYDHLPIEHAVTLRLKEYDDGGTNHIQLEIVIDSPDKLSLSEYQEENVIDVVYDYLLGRGFFDEVEALGIVNAEDLIDWFTVVRDE